MSVQIQDRPALHTVAGSTSRRSRAQRRLINGPRMIALTSLMMVLFAASGCKGGDGSCDSHGRCSDPNGQHLDLGNDPRPLDQPMT